MRQRTISDGFWRNPDIADLSHEDKGTLLYFLTSPSSNIIGCYRVVWMQAAAEMGWTKDQLMVVAKRLKARDLIDFNEAGWVWVKCWWEHNSCNGAFMGKLSANAKLQCTRVPPKWQPQVFEWLRSFGVNVTSDHKVANNAPCHAPSYAPTPDPSHAPATGSVSQYTIPNIQYTTTTTTEPGSAIEQTVVVVDDLIFPPQLSSQQSDVIAELLADSVLPAKIQQALLDELHGAQLVRQISNPIGYIRTIIERAKSNSFKPELGVAIEQHRKQQTIILHAQESDRQPVPQEVIDESLRNLPAHMRKCVESLRPKAVGA